MGQNKLSSYQKLKAENDRLKSDLSVLALYPESKKGVTIKMEWTTKVNIETAVWAGDSSSQTSEGFLKSIYQ